MYHITRVSPKVLSLTYKNMLYSKISFITFQHNHRSYQYTIHVGLSAFSVPAYNKVLTVLSATLSRPFGLHCRCKIFAYGDIFSGLELGSNYQGLGLGSTQDISVFRSHTHVRSLTN